MAVKKPKGKKRYMRSFKMGEISVVDNPAQEPALVSIMKRRSEADEDVNKQAVLTTEAAGHTHLVSVSGEWSEKSSGYTTMDDDHQHPWIMDESGNIVIGAAKSMNGESHTHGVATASKKAEEEENDDMTPEELKKLQERLDALEAKNEHLNKVATLAGAHKTHYDSLDPQLDDDARKAFLEMSAEERDVEVDKAVKKAKETEADDPVIYKSNDGSEYRASDDPRLIKMAKQRDEDRKETIRLQKAAQDADLTKRAESDLGSFPGELAVRKEILKAVDGIEDEKVREEAHQALKAQSARLSKAFKVIGAGGEPENMDVGDDVNKSAAEAELEKKARALAEKEGIDFYEAYEKIADLNLELLEKAIAG